MVNGLYCGLLSKTSEGYEFCYDRQYLLGEKSKAVSLSLPLQQSSFFSKELFPFFAGLAQEGWLKEMSERIFHIDSSDHFSLIVKNGKDCIGNITLEEVL